MLEQIRDGRTDLVFDYVETGNPPDAVDEHGLPLIRWCAYYGDVSAVRRLLEAGASLESLGENLDLNGAAFHGHWQLCRFLIERGADVNHPQPDTAEVPLHAALCKLNSARHVPVVKVLLAAGADPNRATRPGVETGCFMRDVRTRGETPLHRAAAFAGARVIQLLLDAGAKIDAKDANGDSPLTWASWHLRPRGILKLLCYGPHKVHWEPDADSGYGSGGSSMADHLLGRPHL